MRFFRTTLVMVLLLAFAGAAVAQVQVQRGGDNPIYKITINVVERTTTAINYQHRSGATTIDLRGTKMIPEHKDEAKVEIKQGYIEIEVEFDKLQPATRFGSEFLTYVMWAISPEGRPINLGEVILNGTKSKLDVTTDLQAFGLIVTAEPYFSVTQPSNVVVMENFIRPETRGKIEQVDAKFELLERGQYTVNVPPAELKPIPLDKNVPLDLFEAQNALRIARWAGADKDAADSYKKAQDLLTQAENYQARKAGNKPVSMTAREAVQTAEDARLIALKRQEEQRLANERAAAAERENQARIAAERSRQEAAAAAQRSAQAEQEQRLEAERRARAEAERALAEADAARTRADAERTRAEADRARLEAEANVARSARERDAAQADADRARLAAGQAEREKQELRRQLVDQFNKILETRDTARGLIVNMSDVLFDTGKYTLKPGAREKLAKISGIVLA